MNTDATIFSHRLIHEGAVVALVQGKIDALQDRVERGRVSPDVASPVIGALKTVISGLKFIQTHEQAGGPFPIFDPATDEALIAANSRNRIAAAVTLLPDAEGYKVERIEGGLWGVIDPRTGHAVDSFHSHDAAIIEADHRNRH